MTSPAPLEGSGADAGPLVSVVTIFLNEERFLGEAIESVVAQTYGNWELLLCDDGSSDGSPAIARAWAARYPDRIRYLAHPDGENRGMSATRNLGLEHCRGDYVALLDGDDVWLPGKLERQVAALGAAPQVSLVCSRTMYWHSWTGLAEDVGLDRFSRLVGPTNRVVRGRSVLNRILRGTVEAICTCAVLVRREAVVRAGGFESRFRGLFEDQAFFAKLLADEDILVMEECLDLYRQHPDSCCAVATRAMPVVRASRVAFLEWLARWLEQHDGPPSVRRTVQLELWLHRHPLLIAARHGMREARRWMAGSLVSGGFAVARRLIPAPIRLRLWSHYGGDRRDERSLAEAARSGRAAAPRSSA